MLVPLVLSLEGLLWRVGRSGSEDWLEVVSGLLAVEVELPVPEVEDVLGVLSLEGLLWRVGRSGSATGSVSCVWAPEDEPELLPEPLLGLSSA